MLVSRAAIVFIRTITYTKREATKGQIIYIYIGLRHNIQQDVSKMIILYSNGSSLLHPPLNLLHCQI